MRGDIVAVALQGDYGKPRPAVIIQSDQMVGPSVLVCLITSTLADSPLFRLSVEPTLENGLRLPSQVMIDKIATVPPNRMGPTIGRMEPETMAELAQKLALMIDLS